jgi:hypothetical protein
MGRVPYNREGFSPLAIMVIQREQYVWKEELFTAGREISMFGYNYDCPKRQPPPFILRVKKNMKIMIHHNLISITSIHTIMEWLPFTLVPQRCQSKRRQR